MRGEIICVALVLLGFVVGMTFTPSDPWMLLVAGLAAIGWATASWLAFSRREDRLLLESREESMARLWSEKLQLQRDLDVERRRVKITPIHPARRPAAPAILSSHGRSA